MTALVGVIWQTIWLMLGLAILGGFAFVAWEIAAAALIRRWRKQATQR